MVFYAREAAYHDVEPDILTEFHPWLDSNYFRSAPELMEIAQRACERCAHPRQMLFGRMVTGEKFIQDDQRGEINAAHAPLSVDMETAAIAHVCYVNRIPFIAVRTITDTADHSGAGAFEENCTLA